MEILVKKKQKQNRSFANKNFVNQINTKWNINRPGQAEERLSGIEDKVKELLH
jgi:hypothetical protein